MGAFFDMDGPFARFGNLLADIIILSFLWLIFSLPVVTVGASTTALFYVTTKRISNREGYLVRDFWKSFKMNFKVATAAWLIILLMAVIVGVNMRSFELEEMAAMKSFLLPIQLCVGLEIIMVSIYLFPIISRFDMTVINALKTAFLMANKHILTTVICLLIGVGVILAGLATVILLLVGMGAYAFAASYFLMRVFKKYRPDLDSDGDETA